MKKKIFSKELVIGVSVLLALAILFFGIDYLKGINLFKPANFYFVCYDNVHGLEVAAPVTIDGYKVGQVREIEFDYTNHGKIKVLLALDTKLRVPEGSTATIVQSMLSGASIELKMGKSKNILAVGSEIPPYTAPDLMSTISDEMIPTVNSILPRVDSLIYNLNLLVSHPAIYRSLAKAEGMVQNLYSGSEILNATLSSINRQTPPMLGRINSIAGNLDTITDDLTYFAKDLRSVPLAEIGNNVNELTARLTAFSQQLNDQKSTLGLLMNDPELYNRLCRVGADIDSLIVDIKRNPKRYISIKLL